MEKLRVIICDVSNASAATVKALLDMALNAAPLIAEPAVPVIEPAGEMPSNPVEKQEVAPRKPKPSKPFTKAAARNKPAGEPAGPKRKTLADHVVELLEDEKGHRLSSGQIFHALGKRGVNTTEGTIYQIVRNCLVKGRIKQDDDGLYFVP